MFAFLLKSVRGLVVGWMISLVMYLAKRMLARAFNVNSARMGGARPQSYHRSSDQNSHSARSAHQSSADVVETIWVGMSSQQLLKTFGTPRDKQWAGADEIWTYANLNGQGTQTAITVRNGTIANWDDIQPRASAPFGSPSP